ncbi:MULTISPECIES: putative RNA methyltransferase [Marinobacter]|uniref:Methyltransferase domain-containing protein n=1 Tax=Marinobacter metalliresistant TaxID=2961995 RepID=A0ABZ2W3K7_9GAMM|nr:methyltransferase domain-containing protein [Marinobacter sp. Arc7-DN-1]AXS81967.1 methyltransferase domain-containing protein [Marinobacter sp. Arc7-DN-1]
MITMPFDALACPLDGCPLIPSEKTWRCENGHSFDVAKQGYVHLLPVQKKRTLDPGDSKEMVAARQRFLNAGFYKQIADAVSELALQSLPSEGTGSVLDAGSGEGYYLRHLAGVAGDRSLAMIGVDISKWAVLAAAKQDKQTRWVVGSNANLPVLPESVDLVLCLFGFPVYSEFFRVLRSGGQLIQVDAGADHLRELREIIYPELKPPGDNETLAPEGFQQLDSTVVRFPLTLPERDSIADLLAMTPHLYRASSEGLEKAAALESLDVTVDVILKRFEKL